MTSLLPRPVVNSLYESYVVFLVFLVGMAKCVCREGKEIQLVSTLYSLHLLLVCLCFGCDTTSLEDTVLASE